MYEEIKNLIKEKKSDIDSTTLKYFTNYFYVLAKGNFIPSNIDIKELIENALVYASKIEFYDKNHRISLEKGEDIKGFREPETKTIFIKDKLGAPLKEMMIYHELHHAVQTNPLNDQVGINQESNIGKLIMEAQTQYFAEKVYSEVYGINFEEKQIKTEDLKMLPSGIIVSNLHNYELYDNILSKLAILLGVSKDYFVIINFLYKENIGLKDLENKYNEARQKYNLPYDFENLLYITDYIFAVNIMGYVDNPDKKTILVGKTTAPYEIHPNKMSSLSLLNQRIHINSFDNANFLALFQNDGNFNDFARYIVDIKTRETINSILGQSKSI